MAIVLETTIGDLTIDLFIDERPRTCMNFLKLCKLKYYNLNLLFSVQRNFIAQTGDPTGSGRGGDSIFEHLYGKQARYYEGEKIPLMKHIEKGTVSMVSCGKHMFGSQFLITLGENLDSLDTEHLVFGQVIDAEDVMDRLNSVLVDDGHRPFQDIRITHTVVLHDPYPDPEGFTQPSSPIPTEEMLASNYIGAEETIEDKTDKTAEQMKEEIEAKEASARATILEIVGDIPDADVAPPENVLFVCKLNPVTTSDDLEIIFSRFGKIVSCEVIKDRITNNSLQYAFIEYSSPKSCEDAYFKMDNVLIDDRRIHVDFSQSVSKIRWKGKGRIEYYDDKGKKIDNTEGSKKFNPNSTNKNTDWRKNDRSNNKNSNSRDYSSRQDYSRDYNNRQTNHSRDYNSRQTDRSRDYISRQTDNSNSRDYNDRQRDHYRDRSSNNQQRSEDNRHNKNHRHENKNSTSRYKEDESKSSSRHRKDSSKPEELESLMSSKESRQKVLQHLKKELKCQKETESDSSTDSEKKTKKSKKKKKSKHYSSDSDSDSPIKKKKYDSDECQRMERKKKKKKKKSKKSKKKSSYSSDSSD